jgi:kinesin family protein C2/C3
MNEHSSRSHLVMTVYVSADALGGKQLAGISSKLHIIDLAGSERVSKTDATGSRLREAKAINKSLSALGNVMEALAASSTSEAAGPAAAAAAGPAGGAAAGSGRAGARASAATVPRFVPYRDSKLTFLLQDSLRGGSKVLMFANVSPSRYNAPESTTSLQFAQRCRAVQLGRASKTGLTPTSRA